MGSLGGDRREQLPLTGEMALFVSQKVADGGYGGEAGNGVLVALLRYAKLMGFRFSEKMTNRHS